MPNTTRCCGAWLLLTVLCVVQTFKTGFSAGKGGTNRLLAGLPQSAGWLMEAILTFLLVFVVFTATDQGRAQSTSHLPILAPAAIGMTVFICHLAAVPIDGCSVNRKSLTLNHTQAVLSCAEISTIRVAISAALSFA